MHTKTNGLTWDHILYRKNLKHLMFELFLKCNLALVIYIIVYLYNLHTTTLATCTFVLECDRKSENQHAAMLPKKCHDKIRMKLMAHMKTRRGHLSRSCLKHHNLFVNSLLERVRISSAMKI